MAWELAAIWLIVAATIVWFVRDEGRQRLLQLSDQARTYATASVWAHREAIVPLPVVERPQRTMTEVQRRFAEVLRRKGR
ncbi:hypothetical protein NIM87_05745 [Devosia sp. XJ19-1]|uniref:Uncharacterized protein n=1 Tax=Devosia ureilytica TaxID=2952754 RepID=A0A9Q4AN66_9HYPH|nr:hypothetical protein [Devosia ureilytica]MCP8882994.1 hypothetical protein [Devosia ureilytica]MCP8886638.1 hypothetical protein [Devosia ureilytica]